MKENIISSKVVNPYIGPFPFKAGDEDRFFGRKKEAEQLITMIRENQLVIMFGSSGTGKTSLIHAKLFPELERIYFQPVYIRINFAEEDPLETTRKRIITELRSWEDNLPDFKPGQTLIEYAASVNVFKGLVKPVLFFDQFEELFTLGFQNDRLKIEAFIKQLGDLVEMRLPGEYRSQSHLDNLIKFKVVLSLRQDWVALLEDYKDYIPSLLQNRFRLKRFTPSQALEAILLPAEVTNPGLIKESTAKKIIQKIGKPSLMWDDRDQDPDIKNISVDPIVLSIYCFQLFNLAKNKKPVIITDNLVENNSEKSLIRAFYDENLKEKQDIKELIENRLLNEAGIRLTMPLDRLLIDTKITKEQLKKTSDETGIIRMIGHVNSPQVEIIHDQVAMQIFASRREREAEKNKEKLNEDAIALHMEAANSKEKAELEKNRAAKIKRYIATAYITSISVILVAFVGTYLYIKNNTTLNALNNTISTLKKEKSKLQDSISNSNELLIAFADEKQTMTREITTSKKEIEKLKSNNESLSKEKQTLIYDNKSNREQITLLKTKNDTLTTEINNSRKQLTILTQDKLNLTNENTEHKTQIASLTTEKATLLKENEVYNQKNINLTTDNKKLEEENKGYKKEIIDLKKDNDSYKVKLTSSENRVTELTKENNKVKSELDTLKKKYLPDKEELRKGNSP